MNSSDVCPGPLALASQDAGPQILLVGSDARPLHGEAPSLPPSFKGAPGDRADVVSGSRRIVAVGCGKPGDFDGEARFWESAGAAAIDAMRALRIPAANLAAPLGSALAARHFATGATLASYRCVAFRAHKPKSHFEVESLGVPASDWEAGERGRHLGEAVNWARALVDAPANLMTPQAFAAAAGSLAALGVEVTVLDLRELMKLGAGGLLAVGRSSEHPPCLLVCRWKGRGGDDVDLGLVGKGLTFDAGGLNLKPRPGIEKMKLDMAGAAAVVAALRVLAQRKAPLNVAAAIPLCENVIDGTAYRPGDVITSLSGLTIEVDNTDAEGRIVVADAMTYLIDHFKPTRLVDVATLTGSIMATLHEEFAGLFTTDDALAESLHKAGARSGEALWRLPLVKQHDYLVDSEIADVRNLGAPGFFGASGGSAISGAKFLERFATGTKWAHLDIAGVAWATRPLPGVPKGPTGFGVRLLDALAEEIAK